MKSRFSEAMTVTFTLAMYKLLKQVAGEQGVSMRDLIRTYVGKGLYDARYGDGSLQPRPTQFVEPVAIPRSDTARKRRPLLRMVRGDRTERTS